MALPIRSARVICMAAAIVLASCGLGWAQPAGTDPSFERMQAKLKAGDRVTVDLQNGLTVQGRYAGVGPDALAISTSAGERRISRSDVSRVRRHGHGIVLGTIIGTGVGLAAGAAMGSWANNEGHDRDPVLFGLTFLGLGVGAGIDAALNIPRTVYHGSPSRTAFRLEASPRRTAVRLVVAF
jgi:hypothetical protein